MQETVTHVRPRASVELSDGRISLCGELNRTNAKLVGLNPDWCESRAVGAWYLGVGTKAYRSTGAYNSDQSVSDEKGIAIGSAVISPIFTGRCARCSSTSLKDFLLGEFQLP